MTHRFMSEHMGLASLRDLRAHARLRARVSVAAQQQNWCLQSNDTNNKQNTTRRSTVIS